MGKIFNDPPYPVIDRAPGFWQTVGNYSVKDWSIVGALAALGYPVGYAAAGNPSPPFARLSGNMGRPTAVLASTLGGLAGFMMAYTNSWGRLTGYAKNDVSE